MNGRLRAFALTMGILAIPHSSLMAAECENVMLSDTIEVSGQTLALNGMGIRKATFLKVKVYVAGLYLGQKSGDPSAIISNDKPWHLDLNFVREVGAKDISDAWQEGFEKNAPDQLGKLQGRVDTMRSHMVDFAAGDALAFSYQPDRGTAVLVNQKDKGTIEGADFGSALIAIWLGDPPNKDLKQGLLGGKCE